MSEGIRSLSRIFLNTLYSKIPRFLDLHSSRSSLRCGLRCDSVRIPPAFSQNTIAQCLRIGLIVLRSRREFLSYRAVHLLDTLFSFASKLSQKVFESQETVSQTVSSDSAYKICALKGRYFVLAEPEGFEPSRALTPCLVSSEVLSTTQPRLRIFYCTRQIMASFHSLQTCFTASSVPELTLGIR